MKIILGDNATYPMKGTGTVTLHLSQGQVLHLQDVLYVPDLKKNLVFILAMEDKGFKVAFIDGKVTSGRRVSRKFSLLVLELIHSTRLEEVHWGL